MTQQTAIAPTPVQESTCATCSKFKDYNDQGRGECLIFDKVTRKHHTLTSDCQNAIDSEELKEILSTHQAFLKPIDLNFPGRNVYKQNSGYNSSSKVGYVGQNMVGWFANDRHGLTVAERLPSQSEALKALLESLKSVSSPDYPSPIEPESTPDFQPIEPEEDLPYSEFEPGQIVKVIDEGEKDHNEWASFVVVTKIINSNRFSSTGSYLEPDWLFLLSSLDQDGGEMFFVAENEICHPEQSHIIDTSEVF